MFLKVCNVNRFFKSSARQLHSVMEEGNMICVRY